MLPLTTKLTPRGRPPSSVITGVGVPVAETVKEPAVPTLNAALLVLVIAGLWLTVIARLCDALGVVPLAAVKVLVKTPLAVGVPATVPVPLWLSVNVTPAGNVPLRVIVGIGKPLVVTVKDNGVPFGTVTLAALVNKGD